MYQASCFSDSDELLIILAGLLAFDRLTVREYPNIDIPTVTVAIDYSGASAAIVESTVTKVLEDSLSGIEGVDYLSSISRSGAAKLPWRLNKGVRLIVLLPMYVIVFRVFVVVYPIVSMSLSSPKRRPMLSRLFG